MSRGRTAGKDAEFTRGASAMTDLLPCGRREGYPCRLELAPYACVRDSDKHEPQTGTGLTWWPVQVPRPIGNQPAPCRAMPALAAVSRARKPKIELSACSGTTATSTISPTGRACAAGIHNNWSPATAKVPTASASIPNGRGLATALVEAALITNGDRIDGAGPHTVIRFAVEAGLVLTVTAHAPKGRPLIQQHGRTADSVHPPSVPLAQG